MTRGPRCCCSGWTWGRGPADILYCAVSAVESSARVGSGRVGGSTTFLRFGFCIWTRKAIRNRFGSVRDRLNSRRSTPMVKSRSKSDSNRKFSEMSQIAKFRCRGVEGSDECRGIFEKFWIRANFPGLRGHLGSAAAVLGVEVGGPRGSPSRKFSKIFEGSKSVQNVFR